MEDLVNHTICMPGVHGTMRKTVSTTLSTLAFAWANIGACAMVRRELCVSERGGIYEWISKEKPNDVVRVMFENFSSLGLFVEGVLRHKKIRRLNPLSRKYRVDLLVGCETSTDWRFIKREEDKFCNLFGDGKPTRGACAVNTNNGKIKHNQ